MMKQKERKSSPKTKNNSTPQIKGLHVLYHAKFLEKQGMKIVKGQAYNDLFNLSDWDRIYEVMGHLYDSYLNWEIYKCRNITLRQGFDPESVIYVDNYGDTEYNNDTHCFDHHFEPVLYSYTKNIVACHYDGLDESLTSDDDNVAKVEKILDEFEPKKYKQSCKNLNRTNKENLFGCSPSLSDDTLLDSRGNIVAILKPPIGNLYPTNVSKKNVQRKASMEKNAKTDH